MAYAWGGRRPTSRPVRRIQAIVSRRRREDARARREGPDDWDMYDAGAEEPPARRPMPPRLMGAIPAAGPIVLPAPIVHAVGRLPEIHSPVRIDPPGWEDAVRFSLQDAVDRGLYGDYRGGSPADPVRVVGQPGRILPWWEIADHINAYAGRDLEAGLIQSRARAAVPALPAAPVPQEVRREVAGAILEQHGPPALAQAVVGGAPAPVVQAAAVVANAAARRFKRLKWGIHPYQMRKSKYVHVRGRKMPGIMRYLPRSRRFAWIKHGVPGIHRYRRRTSTYSWM